MATTADQLTGTSGDDLFIVDNAGDTVTELANAGYDTIQASVTFILSDNVEKLVLTGFGSINGTGNALDNTIVGNTSSNVLDGGTGNDTLQGGIGADAYYVDSSADVIIEKAAEGVDIVTSTASYTLSTNVENLILAGTAKSGIGNNLGNIITGNDANNIIDGKLGADTMKGGNGDDLYIVNQAADQVFEATGAGNDTVRASCTYTLSLGTENLILTGASAINGFGSTGNNSLTGNAAANILTGNLGRDVLTGGGGKDIFDYNTGIDSRTGGLNRDLITDFTHLYDRIDLSGVDANTMMTGNQNFSFLGSKGAAFTGIAGQLHYLALGANTLIEADFNGDKIADFQIELKGSIGLSTVDFVL